jgi:hypothetical protein
MATSLPDWVDLDSSESISSMDTNSRNSIPARERRLFWRLSKSGTLLLMDAIRGRAEANRRRVLAIGTLGVLRDAAAAGLVELGGAFAKLRQTSFRCPERGMTELLEQEAKRRWSGG